MHKSAILLDQQQCSRRSFKNNISFYYYDGQGYLEWSFGSILNVSKNGIQIKTNRKIHLEKKQPITLLCLIDNERQNKGGEAVRIYGQVAWCNKTTKRFGIKYLEKPFRKQR